MKLRNAVAGDSEPKAGASIAVGRFASISPKTCWFIVGGLTLLAAALRFWQLGSTSLWGDEINFVLHSSQSTFGQYLREYMRHFAPPNFPPHLPVATVIEFVFTRFGNNEFWGRFSAALLGTLTVPLVFIVARRLFDKTTGLTAAALVTLSFFHIYYSREANYYSPLVFFSTAFFAVLWTQLVRATEGKTVGFGGLAMVWLCGTLLLQTHLAALFFVAALDAAALVVMWNCLRQSPKELGARLKKNFLPLIVAHTLSFPLVVPWVVHTLQLQEGRVDIPPHRTLDKMLNLPWQMGWGNFTSWMAPAATVFLVCLALGIIWGLVRRPRRGSTGLLLWIIFFIIVTYLVFSAGKNGYTPHYVISILLPILMLAASGMNQLAEWLAQKTRRPVLAAAFPAVALVWLAGFETRPLQLLYRLPGKPTNWRGIAEWMSQNLPSGTIVYFDWHVNVWQHVPTYYKTPGIICTSTLPVGSADDIINSRYRDFTRATLEKYSDAAYLEAMRLFDVDPRFDALGGRKWQWPDQYFRRRKSFRNEPIIELDRLGICPIQINKTTWGEVDPLLYYNTPEDLIAINRARGNRLFRRFGEGFSIVKTEGFRDWRVVVTKATVELYNLTEAPLKAQVQLEGVAGITSEKIPTEPLVGAFVLDGKTLVAFAMPAGQIRRVPPLELELPSGKTELQLEVDRPPSGTGSLRETLILLVDDIIVTEHK